MRSATKPPIWRFVFAFVLLLTLADSKAAEVLRLPYEHWVAFRIRQGEVVEALTGVVVTRKPGVVEITETQTFGDVTIPQGAVVYILHFEGEGSDFFWYRGRALSGELYADVVSEPTLGYPRRVRSLPITEWWVKVKNSRGQTGWILNSVTSEGFDGMDACGYSRLTRR